MPTYQCVSYKNTHVAAGVRAVGHPRAGPICCACIQHLSATLAAFRRLHDGQHGLAGLGLYALSTTDTSARLGQELTGACRLGSKSKIRSPSRQDCLGGRGTGALLPPTFYCRRGLGGTRGRNSPAQQITKSFRTEPGCHPADATSLGLPLASTLHPSSSRRPRRPSRAWISPPDDLAQGMTGMHLSGAAGAIPGSQPGTQSIDCT